MRVLIQGATIIDGSNRPSYQGDILIEDERIREIGVGLPVAEECEIIAAKGLVAAPGFIDTHSHSDLKILTEPQVLPKVMQGITTEVLGQDGISMAPLPMKYIEDWRKNLAGLDGISDDISWEYETTERYLNMIEEVVPGVNEAYLIPHGNIRMEAMGLDNRQPTSQEMKKMCEILRRELEAGGIGLSSGLIYIPCAYSRTQELIELCKVVAEYQGVFVVHQRSEADDIIPSMKEIIQIGRKSGVNIHFSHFKVCGKKNWDKLDQMLALLDKAKEEEINVSFDQYPYTAGSTMLSVILPPWVHAGGAEKLIERLQDEGIRNRIIEEISIGLPGFDNFIDFAGTDGIFITSTVTEQNQELIGLSLEELGKRKGKHPLQATFDLLVEENNAVGMVNFNGSEEVLKRLMKREEMNACTDGLLAGKPHPRVYGAYARILGKYVREEGALTLEEAVYKLTYKAAKAMNMKERGLIKEGYYADLTLFDPETILDQGDYVNPIQHPVGIEYVLINGNLVVKNGVHTGARSGKVLRR
ncbi:MAG: N-acyl-D-amino-acid deacylase [Herbinix sp.]|jgi:N-acyl-D-amino-acid deacylase|nr:N-acyl-D-amino-acid deacylase [Herbinix sp.]